MTIKWVFVCALQYFSRFLFAAIFRVCRILWPASSGVVNQDPVPNLEIALRSCSCVTFQRTRCYLTDRFPLVLTVFLFRDCHYQ